jgi:hypothetical protein
MSDTINVDVISRSTAPPVGWIPIINKWSPAENVEVSEETARQLLQIGSLFTYIAGTQTLLTGRNFREYFPDGGGGGGGGEGDKSRYTVEKVTNKSTGEVTYKLKQTINNGSPSYVGDVIGLRGNQMLVQYGDSLTILNTALANIKTKIDAQYNFTTFTALNITTSGKTLKQITDELYAKNLPTNTIVTGQLYSPALPFSGNGEAEVMVNGPAFWWTCKSLTTAPYSWNAIAGGGSWSGVKMDWTPTYNNNASGIVYDNTTSGATATDVQNALDEAFDTLGYVNTELEEVL